MKDIIYTIKIIDEERKEEMIVYATTDMTKLKEQVRDSGLYSNENKKMYLYVWIKGLISRAYVINKDNHEEMLKEAETFVASEIKGCSFCNNNESKIKHKITENLPDDVKSINAALEYNNNGQEAILALETGYSLGNYFTVSDTSKILNINYCPVCGRKLID